MKLIQSILVISALLFFINCTAWPALIPPPAGKTKTAVYPIPLPATSTTAPVRITGPAPATATDQSPTPYSEYKLAFNQTLQLGAIDKDKVNITSQITLWESTVPTIATVSSTGLVTSLTMEGETTIRATHPTLTPPGELKLTVSATGAYILAFDGKEFKELYFIPTKQQNEEK